MNRRDFLAGIVGAPALMALPQKPRVHIRDFIDPGKSLSSVLMRIGCHTWIKWKNDYRPPFACDDSPFDPNWDCVPHNQALGIAWKCVNRFRWKAEKLLDRSRAIEAEYAIDAAKELTRLWFIDPASCGCSVATMMRYFMVSGITLVSHSKDVARLCRVVDPEDYIAQATMTARVCTAAEACLGLLFWPMCMCHAGRLADEGPEEDALKAEILRELDVHERGSRYQDY